MSVAMLSKLNHDPSAAHFVSYGSRCAGASKGVKNDIAGVR